MKKSWSMPKVRGRTAFCSLAVSLAVAFTSPAVALETTNLFGTVTAQLYEGTIVAEFPSGHVWAEWRIEWPEAVSGGDKIALGAIRRAIIDDCFGSLIEDSDKKASQRFPTPDKAVQHVFSRAYGKLDTGTGDGDDSFSMHSFDFAANLQIRFAGAGYIGYVLRGYENEGGSGCHSYVTARVFSLATGRPVKEADFMTPSGAEAFPKAFYDAITRKEGVRDFLTGAEDDAKRALGNFVFEPEGIRWWLPPYSLFAGAAGVQDQLMTWKDLRPFLKPGKEQELKAVSLSGSRPPANDR